MDSTGGEIVLDQKRQPTVRALCYRERRRHWGGKTSPRRTTEASRIAETTRPNTAEIETQPIFVLQTIQVSEYESLTVSNRCLQA